MANLSFRQFVAMAAAVAAGGPSAPAQETPDPASVPPAALEGWEAKAQPVLEAYCYDCHADGASKGDVAFDGFGSTAELIARKDLWMKVLKNVRGGIMPPPGKDRPDAEEMKTLEDWIIHGAFGHDPANPDPGRVTLRRLNRTEYRNTIRDLMGIDYRTDEEFPADDSGYGFDNIGDVLSVSPLLLEKYMQAAAQIVEEAVPVTGRVPGRRRIGAGAFRGGDPESRRPVSLSLYNAADLAHTIDVPRNGTWRVEVEAAIRESFDFDPGRARVTVTADDEQVWQQEVAWGDKDPEIVIERKWEAGPHRIALTVEPLTDSSQRPKDRGEGMPFVDFELRGVTLRGPMEPEHWELPRNYERFFPRESPPEDRGEWPAYLREVIAKFAGKAFRRPVDPETLDRLTAIGAQAWEDPDTGFEPAAARAITAVLASPRFLFRVEETLEPEEPGRHPRIDEYTLATRLSYFLWSTMPDETLLDLASRGELRNNLGAQLRRMVADGRVATLAENFAGQWLQTRDVVSVSIDGRVVTARDEGREGGLRNGRNERRRINEEIDRARAAGDDEKVKKLQGELDRIRREFLMRRDFSPELRRSMQQEAELFFRHIITEDRSVLDLLDSDYTFANGVLAQHYGIPGVEGNEMRRVSLPEDSPRGGVLTMGAVLAVTSNPTRTSPVKRGLYVLENILGVPPAPPPPDIPPLEDAENRFGGREPTLRETLALHRESSLCASCHNRMDPLGLAFENFNAMGRWRDRERGQPIEQEPGKLITGEEFADVRELKKVLRNQRQIDFYRCITEKLLTFALGRGVEPCDVPAVDAIVQRLVQENGRFSALLTGIVESVPFQRRRVTGPGS